MSVRPELLDPSFFTVVVMKSIENGFAVLVYLECIAPNQFYSARKRYNPLTLFPIAR
jgi:hypothetical protein